MTEREFDAPLLAMLAAQGFFDVHFTHGGFEFGKDIIAKRFAVGRGEVCQYAIQAKGGDIGLGDWRTIRPQLVEAFENNLSHPNFDVALHRVVVLATTGQLKGGATLESQEFGSRVRSQGGEFEIWDKQQFLDWLTLDPKVAFPGSNDELLQLVANIARSAIREQQIESYARRWHPRPDVDDRVRIGAAAIEAALIANQLRLARRLDLAAYTALHLLRASWATTDDKDSDPCERPPLASSAIALFADYASILLGQVEPKLAKPKDLLEAVMDSSSIITYPVACCRLIEIISLLALVCELAPDLASVEGPRATAAVIALASHPGSSRPISDDFAVSLIAPTIALHRQGGVGLGSFLNKAALWAQERYDEDEGGLGLGAHNEPEDVIAERLLGSALASTQLTRRRTSYVASVILDLAVALDMEAFYEAFRHNLTAMDIIPTTSVATGRDFGERTGSTIQPMVILRFEPWERGPITERQDGGAGRPPLDELLVASSTRSRHNYSCIVELVQ